MKINKDQPRIDTNLIAKNPKGVDFKFKNDERPFATRFLKEFTNFHLQRIDQGKLAGDFIAIDMSNTNPRLRRSFLLDLKQNSNPNKVDKIQVGGGGAGNQFSRSKEVIEALGLNPKLNTPVAGNGMKVIDKFREEIQTIRSGVRKKI